MAARIRPGFELRTESSARDILDRAARLLRTPGCPLAGLVTTDRIELCVPSSRQFLWSPELRVEVREYAEGTLLVAEYGPHPHVWTLYVGIYATIVFSAFVASVFAFAQWTMDASPVALVALPPLALLALAVHGLGYLGQALGRDQMEELASFLNGIVQD